jgi:hypothetical protein
MVGMGHEVTIVESLFHFCNETYTPIRQGTWDLRLRCHVYELFGPECEVGVEFSIDGHPSVTPSVYLTLWYLPVPAPRCCQPKDGVRPRED